MKEALRAKFEQNLVLKQKLLDTADKDIVELSNDDTYWSQLPDGTGRLIHIFSEITIIKPSYVAIIRQSDCYK